MSAQALGFANGNDNLTTACCANISAELVYNVHLLFESLTIGKNFTEPESLCNLTAASPNTTSSSNTSIVGGFTTCVNGKGGDAKVLAYTLAPPLSASPTPANASTSAGAAGSGASLQFGKLSTLAAISAAAVAVLTAL